MLELAVCRSIHLRDVDRTGAEASCGRLVSDLSMQDFLVETSRTQLRRALVDAAFPPDVYLRIQIVLRSTPQVRKKHISQRSRFSTM